MKKRLLHFAPMYLSECCDEQKKKIIFPAGDRSLGGLVRVRVQIRSGSHATKTEWRLNWQVWFIDGTASDSCLVAGSLRPVTNGDLVTTLTDNRNAVRIQQSAAVRGNTSDILAWYMGDQSHPVYYKYRLLHSAVSTQAHNKWDNCSTSPKHIKFEPGSHSTKD
jgi:hypothetical protein